MTCKPHTRLGSHCVAFRGLKPNGPGQCTIGLAHARSGTCRSCPTMQRPPSAQCVICGRVQACADLERCGGCDRRRSAINNILLTIRTLNHG